MPGGQPTKYNEDMLQKAKDYLVDYSPDVIPSVVGLARHLKVASKTIYNWAENDESGRFLHTLAQIKDSQHAEALNKGLDGTFNATIVKLLLANHGYSEKQSTVLSGPGGKPIVIDNLWTIEVIEPDA